MVDMDKNLSVRRFSELLEARLTEMPLKELREWVRDVARDVPSGARRAFLDGLQAGTGKVARPDKEGSGSARLLTDIAAVRQRLDHAMKKEPEWVYDDDEEPLAFEEFSPELERLFARSRSAFGREAFTLAAEAYRALFDVVAMEDEFGRSVTLPSGLVRGTPSVRQGIG